MEREQFYREVVGFLTRTASDAGTTAPPADIDPDDNLFDLGLVNSFSMIRMIVFVEETTGVAVDLADHELETFYTLRGLYDVVAGTEERV
ncbi:acyl carrier protein [Micromonospora lutea]|uniref:Carrier domain-containing protein n=1 Tax=Micromonospora lutea TaxID=419825 RepID=A0ABQ4J282_9ACTN|nr:acyl carrier protein [Micromonospora lutea]GIJ24270.1 hypothetical protein Vlu01_48940 [Micromonospora lutea]